MKCPNCATELALITAEEVERNRVVDGRCNATYGPPWRDEPYTCLGTAGHARDDGSHWTVSRPSGIRVFWNDAQAGAKPHEGLTI